MGKTKRAKRGPYWKPGLEAERLAYWEGRFPEEKGNLLRCCLLPIYGWQPKLMPALADLDGRARTAIFWRETTGVRQFRPIEGDALQVSLSVSIGSSLLDVFEGLCRDEEYAAWQLCFWAMWPGLCRSRNPFKHHHRDALEIALFRIYRSFRDGQPEEAARFKPFIELWRAGNFPVGFDKDGNLLVLVA